MLATFVHVTPTTTLALRRLRQRQQHMRGMTLIEIMVVVAIISLVMGGIGIAAYNQFEASRVKTARNETIVLSGIIEQYRIAHRGRCPRDLAVLKSAGLASKIRSDPWGSPYTFKCEGTEVFVGSAGPDAELETGDDIRSDEDESESEAEEAEK